MNGILIVDKPEGFTSHDCIAKVRGILRMKAVGHTGTLDPFATGVLVILLGKATRLAQFLDKSEKEYLADVQFGFSTDTGDRTGSRIADGELRIEEIAERLTPENLERAFAKFRGDIWQTPSMYSAKKIAGKKLYELARKGETVERQPVKVKISKLELTENSEQIRNPQSAIRILTAVSAGTYIRVLAEDIGKELKIGAHLAELRRTRAGNFDLSQAVTLGELEKLRDENCVENVLIPMSQSLAHLPRIILTGDEIAKILHGQKISAPANLPPDGFIRICDESENLIAVGVALENIIQPKIVLSEKLETRTK